SQKMSEMEALRMLMVKRGNIQEELALIGEEAGEGTEIQTVTLFKLMKAFEKVAQRLLDKKNHPVHTVISYNYTMEGTREYMLDLVKTERSLSFTKIFDVCEDRIHAIFLFLNILELVQSNYMKIISGSGINNFIIEYNEERVGDIAENNNELNMKENLI
ncbi:MAG: chromosome segregation protein ScpA, partial [Ginsengibacter sp.]